ncbi:phosphate propanoyltransferase [Paenibacillus aestuarii]|uniref:Phosphate propanoyltransferase n=1 Tax=Paenibacillus aestuarii TaxID=516965 RepID=A0ABW0K5J3_9BACL|nr:phosphate propanoyltransferase [Paenibacillus aestuarii]
MAFITERDLRARSTGLAGRLPNPFPLREGDRLTPAAADFLRSRGIALKLHPAEAEAEADALSAVPAGNLPLQPIPVGVSGRHIHLSEGHVEELFGAGYRLSPLRELSQPGQFAAQETVTLVGPKGILPQVRILGPSRGATQVEIAQTDGYALGVHPPVRLSGQLAGTPGITIVGPLSAIRISEGVIIAKNHVHMSLQDAAAFQVVSGDRLMLQTMGERPVIFADVIVRVSERYVLDFHVDTDEGNAAGLRTGDTVMCIGKKEAIRGDRSWR